MTRVAKVTVGVVTTALAVLLLAVVSVAALLGSEAGSRWVLKQVPGLTVEHFQGRLSDQWRADRLLWSQGETSLQVQAPSLQWSPACLFRMTLCVNQLHAERVSLDLPPGPATSSGESPSLPALSLPIALELSDLRVGQFLLNGSEQLRDVTLNAQWTAAGIQIDSAHLAHGEWRLDLAGSVQPTGQWPLHAKGQLQLPAIDGVPWQLALEVDGPLLQQLTVGADSSGYLAARLDGEVAPLKEHLPARLRIISESFKPGSALPDTLQLDHLVLDGEGDLATGYRLAGNASLPAEGSPMALALQGRVDADGADIASLDLTASATEHVALSGHIDWHQGLQASARFDWANFPWHRLYPLVAEPQVKAQALTGEISYRDGRYLGNFNGRFAGPVGSFSLVSPFSGDLSQVFLPQFELTAGQGKATGHINLGFAEGLSWDTALDLSAINPAYWMAELPGTLAGPLRSKGQWRNAHLLLDADLDLKGRLRGQPAILQLQAQVDGEQWSLNTIDLRLGGNRISGAGSMHQQMTGKLALNLPQLGQLWPDLQGQLKGQLQIAGTLQAPQGQLQLQGQQLSLGKNRLHTLDLLARLDNHQRGSVDLAAGGINAGETALGTLALKGQGDHRQQQLQVTLQGPLLNLAMAVDGTLDKDGWRGRLATGDVQAGGQDWRLQAPARLERLANGTINFGAHCWTSAGASLCGDDQRLAPQPRLRYHLKQFPLDSLARFLPRDLAWQGLLSADLDVDLPASGPSGKISIDASHGTLRIRDNEQWLDLPYQALNLESRLSPERVDTLLTFEGGKLGSLRVNSSINPLKPGKPISGDFSLSGLDVSVARPFVPQVETLAGLLQGSGHISGTLLDPHVIGTVNLTDGEVSGGQLPVPFKNLRIGAMIEGQTVQLNGVWTSGVNGQGTLGGHVGWGNALAVDVDVKGSRLPVTVEPYAELEAAPNLHIRLADNRLAITGKVAIPKGTITVRELPPSTVKLSGDTVIIGEQAPAQSAQTAMQMNIDVVVGEDQLAFSGFGLSANLVGHVHIGDNLDTRGELSLNDGKYRAYGQRLTIRRARLLFTGPIAQPYLDIEAIRQTDDVIAGIRLTGNAQQPRSEVFSEPTMSQEQALSYLVLGRPLSTSSEDNNMLAQAALGLGLAGSASTTGKLASDLGIKDFQLDTQGSGTTTAVVASGNLTDKLILRYGVGVFEPASTVALRYLLSKQVYVEAASGLASSLDIFYKRDF